MKVGLPLLFEYQTVEDNLILAKKLGLDFVELNLNFSYCRKAMEDGTLDRLHSKYDLKFTLHFFDEADFGSYNEVVDAYLSLLKKYASLAKGYVKMVNFHNNAGPYVTISGVKHYIYSKEYDEYIVRLINNLKKAKEILDEYGMDMVIENVDLGADVKFLSDNFIELSKRGFHFNLDVGHDYINGCPFTKLIEKNSFVLDEMHLHDAKDKMCHLQLGTGVIPVDKYLNLAKENDLYLLLEVKSSKDLEESIKVINSLK